MEPFLNHDKFRKNKRKYSIFMLQALLLAQCQAEPFKGLKTTCHQLQRTKPVMSFYTLLSPPLQIPSVVKHQSEAGDLLPTIIEVKKVVDFRDL